MEIVTFAVRSGSRTAFAAFADQGVRDAWSALVRDHQEQLAEGIRALAPDVEVTTTQVTTRRALVAGAGVVRVAPGRPAGRRLEPARSGGARVHGLDRDPHRQPQPRAGDPAPPPSRARHRLSPDARTRRPAPT